MTTKNHCGPAFPLADSCFGYENTARSDANGMTIRDYFAAKAMQAYFTDPDVGFGSDVIEAGARAAYRIADAMLKARETP
jgi:hypothetical protein